MTTQEPATNTVDARQSDSSRIIDRSATELARAIRERELRSVDVTKAFLDRIRQHDEEVHAISWLDENAALQQAEAADRAVTAGLPLGPLHGVPMTIKDGYRVAGMRSSFGVPHLKFYRPKADCEVIARLRRAGAVLMGRTAVPFACFDWQCKPPLGRECVNPLDSSRTPGGSSGGAAAALAARFTPLELGTDVAGSVRYPAHCCGVFGLRTSVGLLPMNDAGPPGPQLFPSLLAAGPMARTPADLELLLSALLPAVPEPIAQIPDRLRIAVTPSVIDAALEVSSNVAITQFVNRLRDRGHDVTVLDVPPFDFTEGYKLWGLLAGYELKKVLPFGMRNRVAVRAFAAWFLKYRLGDGPLTQSMRQGLLATEAEYHAGLAARDDLMHTMAKLFLRYDLWVLPTSPTSAITRKRAGTPFLQDGQRVSYSQYLGAYLCPTAVVGTPSLVAPVGTDKDGLPIGVQLHAARFADRRLVRIVSERLSELFCPSEKLL